jgi:CRISPR-associated protein Cas2
MHILIGYDVNTETPAGKKRLRKVAEVCEDYGQRVQWSLFECSVDAAQFEKLRARLLGIINEETDSLRIYKLHGDRAAACESYGLEKYTDLTQPLLF